jgi:hypothetical protein
MDMANQGPPLLREHVADGQDLGLIEGFLTQGVLEHTGWTEAEEGTPQGGAIGRFLCKRIVLL